MTVLTLFSLWLSILPVQKNGEALTYNHEPVFLVLLGDGLNRLARIGISAKDAPSEGACITGDHWYFVACWDPEKMAFIKKILVAGGKEAHDWSEHWPFKSTKSSEEPCWPHALALGQYRYGNCGIRMSLLYMPCWTNFMADIMVKVVTWRIWKP